MVKDRHIDFVSAKFARPKVRRLWWQTWQWFGSLEDHIHWSKGGLGFAVGPTTGACLPCLHRMNGKPTRHMRYATATGAWAAVTSTGHESVVVSVSCWIRSNRILSRDLVQPSSASTLIQPRAAFQPVQTVQAPATAFAPRLDLLLLMPVLQQMHIMLAGISKSASIFCCGGLINILLTCMWFVLAFACMGWVLNQLICSACVVDLLIACMLLVPWLARLLLDSTPHTSLLYACRSIPFAIPFCKSIPCYDCIMLPASTPIEPKAVLVLVCLSLHRACGNDLHGTICMPAELEIN